MLTSTSRRSPSSVYTYDRRVASRGTYHPRALTDTQFRRALGAFKMNSPAAYFAAIKLPHLGTNVLAALVLRLGWRSEIEWTPDGSSTVVFTSPGGSTAQTSEKDRKKAIQELVKQLMDSPEFMSAVDVPLDPTGPAPAPKPATGTLGTCPCCFSHVKLKQGATVLHGVSSPRVGTRGRPVHGRQIASLRSFTRGNPTAHGSLWVRTA